MQLEHTKTGDSSATTTPSLSPAPSADIANTIPALTPAVRISHVKLQGAIKTKRSAWHVQRQTKTIQVSAARGLGVITQPSLTTLETMQTHTETTASPPVTGNWDTAYISGKRERLSTLI